MSKKPYIMLNETQVKRVIDLIVLEQSDLDEYGVKGMWKPKWNAEDQILAMYNSLYGIEDLGITKEELANDIIGSSLGALAGQTSNFDYLSGKGGFDRPHKTQSPVYERFKGFSQRDLKNLCLDIIEKRLANPESSAEKFKIGQKIGNKRDEAKNERETKLRDAGINPDRATMIGQRPKFEPTPDEEEPIDTQLQSPRKNTPKDEIKNFLQSLYQKATESNPDLAEDIQFISDYIDSELVDKEMMAEIRKLFKPTIINENKMEKVIKIKQSDIKNIIKRINEQEFVDEEDSALSEFETVVLKLMDMGFSSVDLSQRMQDLNLKYFKKHSDAFRQERMNRSFNERR